MNTKKIDIKEDKTAGAHISYWTDTEPGLKTISLSYGLKTEVVIIGGGISGLSIAYTLCKRGKKVVLIEDGYIGSGETGRTTAHLVNALDDRYYTLQKVFGEKNTKLIAQSHTEAIRYIEQIVNDEKIDCDFKRVDGYLFLHPSDKPDSLEKELKAAKEAGIDVELVNNIPGMLDGKRKAIKFKDQAQFHIMKYMNGLCEAIQDLGGEIYTHTHAETIEKDHVITSEGHRIDAEHIVVATNAPVNSMFQLPTKQYAYRTYAIAGLVKKGTLPSSLWWDTGDFDASAEIPPYHYVRTSAYNNEYDLLISGGEDHPTGLADADGVTEEKRYDALEVWTQQNFPVEKILYHWSGQVMEPFDHLAYIGHSPGETKNTYIASGDSGNGMTHGTIAGLIIPDLIMEKENPWKEIYDPSRFKFFKSGKTFLKENIEGYISYLKTKPKDMGIAQIKELQKGEGIIVKQEKEKYGVSRDEKGALHWVSAECTHMKCIVKWNSDEKSWDCPCHGSRFTYKGEVMNGPANTPLEYHTTDPKDLEGEIGD